MWQRKSEFRDSSSSKSLTSIPSRFSSWQTPRALALPRLSLYGFVILCFLLAYRERQVLRGIQRVVESRLWETCLDPDGPVPCILMTLGRSGSHATWQIIGNLTGYETPSEEYCGSDDHKSANFFKSHSDDEEGQWMLRHLCEQQLSHPPAGVVGFKWKPFESIFSPPAIAALRVAAELERPRIRVIRNRRNLLDYLISRHKHHVVKLGAHCTKGQNKCLQKHMSAGTGLIMPTDDLLERLTFFRDQEDAVDKMLAEMEVPTVEVSYEKLYEADDASEWMRIFAFLGVGPTKGLTRAEVEGAMEYVPTHNPTQKKTLGNFANVSSLLQGTEFEHLLH